MPASGDQHRPAGASENPFEEDKPRMSEYTAREIATLQSRLDKQLGPEFLSCRPGPGGQKVHYLTADKVINLANSVFGFNGWSSSIKTITIDFIDEPQPNKISMGLSVIVRVTLKDGTYHEDIGYGSIANSPSKAAAFEKAKKEGTTDALKRALRSFGNVLGNCLYDKDFVGRVSKIKVQKPKLDADNLHRHADYVPVKREEAVEAPAEVQAVDLGPTVPSNGGADTNAAEEYDEFGLGDMSDIDFSDPLDPVDYVYVPTELPPGPKSAKPVPQANNGLAANASLPRQNDRSRPENRLRQSESRPMPDQVPKANPPTSKNPQPPAQDTAPSNPPESVAFFSAASLSRPTTGPPPRFNPHADSPSMRRSSGIDHGRSGPIARRGGTVVETAPVLRDRDPTTPAANAPARDFINPSNDPHRRVGAPLGRPASPAPRAGGSAYRPPTRRDPDTTRPAPAGGMNGNGNGNIVGNVPLPAQGAANAQPVSRQHDPPQPIHTSNPPPQQHPTSTHTPAGGTKRPPLNDVSNFNTRLGPTGSDDAKRQRLAPGGPDAAMTENISPGPQQFKQLPQQGSGSATVGNGTTNGNVPLPGSR